MSVEPAESMAPAVPQGGANKALRDPPVLDGADIRSSTAIARNVVANWAGHLVFIIGGFILPRFVCDHLGQARLGVWDFGWSTVAYLSLLNAGIASSVNRYVARYRAVSDWEALNRTASSCGLIFTCTSAVAVAITAGLVCFLSEILPTSFQFCYHEIQWLLLMLGLSSAINLYMPVYNGVITGYQRYDLVTYIEGACQIIIVTVIIVLLLLGHGLVAMGSVVLLGTLAELGLKRIVAYRICPELRLSFTSVGRHQVRDVATFGGKMFVDQMSRMALYQGSSFFVGVFLGPACLAVFARSMTLVMHVNKLLFHFARVLVPSVSALQARETDQALSRFVIQGARYSTLIALPAVLSLAILADPLIRIWMGPAFAQIPILLILSIGHLAFQAQTGAFYALVGLNRHGIPSLATFLAAVLSLVATIVGLKVYHLGLVSVALNVGVALTLVNVLVVPLIVARSIGVPMRRYFAELLSGVPKAVAPFAVYLLLIRVLLARHDYLLLGAAALGGGLVLTLSYWRWVLPSSLKARVLARIGSPLSRLGQSAS